MKLLNAHNVRYLLIGGYAVNYYGYSRATADIDIWISGDIANTERAVQAIREFGFSAEDLTPSLLSTQKKIIRMGIPPFRIEVMADISGVLFEECYAQHTVDTNEDIAIHVIGREQLIANKKASGRTKDLVDLEFLGKLS